MTTTTDQPRITVTKHTQRRADIDGRPVAVQSANRLDDAIMAIITEQVRAHDTPHLVHIVGLGQDDWRLADPRSTEFPRVDPPSVKVPEAEPSAAADVASKEWSPADDADPEEPAYKPWTPPRPKTTTPPVIGRSIVPGAAATDDADGHSGDVPINGSSDPTSADVAGRPAAKASLPSVDEVADHDAAEGPEQAPPPASRPLPSWDDMVGVTRTRPTVAQEGWRALFRLPPGRAELVRRADIEQIQALPGGCWTIVVVNPKGGATKTTATRQIAATFSRHLVGPAVAWDNNPSRGNLGSRVEIRPVNTVLDLLRDLPRLQRPGAQLSELAQYARLQPEGFYALASARRTTGMKAITRVQVDAVQELMERFARIIVIDTGNDETSESWQAAVRYADQLVIVSEAAQDTAEGAADMMTDLRDSAGSHLVDQAIAVVSQRATAGGRARRQFVQRMGMFFAEHTRVVVQAPFDAALDGGGKITQSDLSRATKRAWERVAAAAVEGFAREPEPAFKTGAGPTRPDESRFLIDH